MFHIYAGRYIRKIFQVGNIEGRGNESFEAQAENLIHIMPGLDIKIITKFNYDSFTMGHPEVLLESAIDMNISYCKGNRKLMFEKNVLFKQKRWNIDLSHDELYPELTWLPDEYTYKEYKKSVGMSDFVKGLPKENSNQGVTAFETRCKQEQAKFLLGRIFKIEGPKEFFIAPLVEE